MGWSIDSKQDSTLVVNALDIAIRNRRPEPGGIVHADHGAQFTSWVFGQKIRSAGLLPSFGTVGDGLDNAMMESFWSSMQIELLDRKRWKTRVELAKRDLRLHRDLPQPPTPALRARLPDRPRSNTRCSTSTTQSQLSVSQPKWNPNGGAGQEVPIRSADPGADYGEVDAVMIDADIYGWATRVGSLSKLDRSRLSESAEELQRSIAAFPFDAQPYYERVLRIARLALST